MRLPNGCNGHPVWYTDPADPDDVICDIEWCDGSCGTERTEP